jgi:hypothetical protein
MACQMRWVKHRHLLCFAVAMLTFFIAGPVYLLCFERVDNLGACRIRAETAFSSHLITKA